MIHWVWEPTLKVLDTIRVKEENQQFGVSSKEGLRSDLASLERMVVQFAKEHYSLSDQEIVQLGNKVRDGDMSVILRAYENEIKVNNSKSIFIKQNTTYILNLLLYIYIFYRVH